MSNQNWNDQGQDPNSSESGQDWTGGDNPDASSTSSSWDDQSASSGQAGDASSGGYSAPDSGAAQTPDQSAGQSYNAPDQGAVSFDAQPAANADPYGQAPQYGQQSQDAYGQQSQDAYGQQQDPYGQGAAPQDPSYGYPPAPYSGGYDPSQQYGYAGPVVATWGKRALGGLIDFVVPSMILGTILSIVLGNDPEVASTRNVVSTVLGLAWYGVLAYLSGTTGQTPGRKIAKTRLVSEATGQPIGVGMTFVRYLCHYLDSLACMIGWLWPLWDKKRQTFADKIVKTQVIEDASTGQPTMR